jgi:hypothetical protein
VEGVVVTLVDPTTEMAYLEYDPALTNPEALFAVVERSGFAPSERVAVRREQSSAGQRWPLPISEQGRSA